VSTDVDPDDLRAALIAAFPAEPITRDTIDEPLANWDVYEEAGELSMLEGKTWLELDAAVVEHHDVLMPYAGNALFRATLPAYLLYLVEHPAYNEVPFHVGGQLSRADDPTDLKTIDRRVAPLTAGQRAAVRRVIGYLTTREPMKEVMARALETWDRVLAGEVVSSDNQRT